MPNNYFQFKKFKVFQERCAMKVCTDACLFGAYVQPQQNDQVLDIGTGTGLLSLMLAQKNNLQIDAIEIDMNAFMQARENFLSSPWKTAINIYHSSVQEFRTSKKYNCIICNPPFFSNHLKSMDMQRNQALHHESLSFEELVQSIQRLLHPKGTFWLLLPYNETHTFATIASKHHLYPVHHLHVRNKPDEKIFRVVSSFKFCEQKPEPSLKELYIRNNSGEYSEGFQALLKEFYLIF